MVSLNGNKRKLIKFVTATIRWLWLGDSLATKQRLIWILWV